MTRYDPTSSSLVLTLALGCMVCSCCYSCIVESSDSSRSRMIIEQYLDAFLSITTSEQWRDRCSFPSNADLESRTLPGAAQVEAPRSASMSVVTFIIVRFPIIAFWMKDMS